MKISIASIVLWLKEPLTIGAMISAGLHLAVLNVHFIQPSPAALTPLDSRMEVILVNAKTNKKPVNPDVVAQHNMEAGGDRDEGRATSPVKASNKIEDGEDLVRKKRKVADLEETQRQLMAMTGSPTTFLDKQKNQKKSADAGTDNEDIQFVIQRMQAEIAKNISDYNKRPRRLTYGVNAVGVSYARYVTDWAARIEEIGTERYPKNARGKVYDSMVIMVEIKKDGHVGDIQIKKKSKHAVLNRAIKEIVFAGAPYERFTDEMAAEGDILQIVRTWKFTNRSLQTSNVKNPRK